MCGCCDGDSHAEEKPSPKRKGLTRNNVCCTDILFLIVFVAFWGFMLYISVYSIMQGDARRLVFGYDSFGNTCNKNNEDKKIENLTLSGMDMTNLTNVLFMSVFDPFNAKQICVSQCPTKDLESPEDVRDFAVETGSRLCQYDIENLDDYLDKTKYSKKGPCPELPIYKSISLLQRCAPDPSMLIGMVETPENKNRTSTTQQFFQIFQLDTMFRKVLSDLYYSYVEMIILCVAAVVMSFIMVLLIRFLAGIIVWLIVILAAVGSLVGTGFLWWTFYQVKTHLDQQEVWRIPPLDVDIKNEKALLIFAIIASVLTLILLLIILVLRKRIALTVALFKEAGKCLVDLPLLLVQPIWTFVVLAVFLVYWIIIMAFIATAGYPEASYDKGFTSVEYRLSGLSKHFWWIQIINLIWTSEFILACQQFVIAGAVSSWYFSREKKKLSCPIGKAVCRLILHHIGTVALGSFIIMLVKLPRYILMYIQSKFEGNENCCAKCCIKCCICCLWCLEKVLKFLNQNAYTITAITGDSFCPAARQAFSIIASNVLRVAAINSVGGFVLFLGKVGIMAATCAISVIWLRTNPLLHFYAIPVFLVCVFAYLCAHCALNVYDTSPELHLYTFPVLLVCVFSYMIAHCFLSMYKMVVDVLLLCFCEDCLMNDGTEGKEYFMSHSLMDFVKKTSGDIDKLNRGAKDVPDGSVSDREMTPLTRQ